MEPDKKSAVNVLSDDLFVIEMNLDKANVILQDVLNYFDHISQGSQISKENLELFDFETTKTKESIILDYLFEAREALKQLH